MKPDAFRSLPRVHIVEDERIVALDLRSQLEDLGYEVTGISCAVDEAKRATAALRPGVVLMDINLGRGGDGVEAAREILRELGIPVIYLTAYAEQETVQRANETPAYGYLLKPVEMRELNAMLQTAWARYNEEQKHQQLATRYRMALDAGQLGVLECHMGNDTVLIDGNADPLLTAALSKGLHMPGAEFRKLTGAQTWEQLQGLTQAAEILHTQLRWRVSDTQWRWIELHATLFAAQNMVVGVFRDITEAREQAQQVRQAAVVFTAADEAIAILDAAGRIISVNPSFERQTGWTQQAVQDRQVQNFLFDRREPFPAVPHTPHAPLEVACRRADGSQFPALEHCAPVHDSDGHLTQQVLTFTDISALRRAEGDLRHIAFHDALTDLPNRLHLEAELTGLLNSTATAASCFALMYLDLDGFKTINDSLGHDRGDRLLRTIAERLRLSLRAGDFLARIGGDEFVLIIGHDEAPVIDAVVRKLLAACAEPVEVEPGLSVRVTASIGVVRASDVHRSGSELLKAADSAMYAAKASGRNTFCMFRHELTERNQRRLQIEQGLRQALATGSLSLAWQPVVDMHTLEPQSAEALLRWHPEYGSACGPDEFIPVAEDSGLMPALGHWVLQRALQQLQDWRTQGFNIPRIAINVSPLQLHDCMFVEALRDGLQRQALDAAAIEIEVTETSLHAHPGVSDQLVRLRDLGAGIALDDFGVGYSALGSLKNLPLTRLKIDKTFVRDLEQPGHAPAIARAIVELAAALGLHTTAEGVETESQQTILRSLGIDSAQGWLYAKALPAEALPGWWQQTRR